MVRLYSNQTSLKIEINITKVEEARIKILKKFQLMRYHYLGYFLLSKLNLMAFELLVICNKVYKKRNDFL